MLKRIWQFHRNCENYEYATASRKRLVGCLVALFLRNFIIMVVLLALFPFLLKLLYMAGVMK